MTVFFRGEIRGMMTARQPRTQVFYIADLDLLFSLKWHPTSAGIVCPMAHFLLYSVLRKEVWTTKSVSCHAPSSSSCLRHPQILRSCRDLDQCFGGESSPKRCVLAIRDLAADALMMRQNLFVHNAIMQRAFLGALCGYLL